MKHAAFILSLVISLVAIYLLLPVAFEVELGAVRLVFGGMALAYSIILLGSILVVMNKAGRSISIVVSTACAFVPIVWLVGCLDAGMISGMEVLSALTISSTVVFQWFVYQAYRIKNEA
jgi:hypothetical protein